MSLILPKQFQQAYKMDLDFWNWKEKKSILNQRNTVLSYFFG